MTSVARPQTIQIYLPGGDPAGIRIAELTTRTVRVIDVPRPLLSEFKKREEFHRVGVYFLFGPGDDDDIQCYIGQSGDVGERLQQHVKGKEFWTRALVAVSLTNTWTSTHATYLEWQSIDRAQAYGRVSLQNGNSGGQPHTPDPLKADCQEFFETIGVLLTTLGQPVLDPLGRSAPKTTDAESQPDLPADSTAPPHPIVFHLTGAGCDARGYSLPEGFLVLAGSRGRLQTTPSIHDRLVRQRERLLNDGTMTVEGDQVEFLKDCLFNSPSSAGGVLRGRVTNGRNDWQTEDGRTLGTVEEEDLARELT